MTYNDKQMNTIAFVSNPHERVILRVLIISCISLFILYVYFVGIMIFKTIDRKITETQTRDILTTVAKDEADYFRFVASLDINDINTYGLYASQNVLFAKRTSDTTLSLNSASHAF